MKKLLWVSVALVLSLVSVKADDHSDRNSKAAFDLIQNRMGTLTGLWMGTSREEFFDCGIELSMDGDKLTAVFFYPSGSGRDTRGVFQLGSDTRISTVNESKSFIEVKNKYAVSGTRRKTTRKASISFEMNPDHTIHQVNIGWNEDNQYPIPTYGCVLDR